MAWNGPIPLRGPRGLAGEDGEDGTFVIIGGLQPGGSSLVADGNYGDIVVTGGGLIWTVPPAQLQFGQIQNVADNSIIGRRFHGGPPPVFSPISAQPCTEAGFDFLAAGGLLGGGVEAQRAFLNINVPVFLEPEQGEDGLLVPGSRGVDGVAGATGATGPAGPPGSPVIGEDGEDAFPIPGPVGPQGVQGIPGVDGSAGLVGATGATGPAGTPGQPGQDGGDGDDGLTVPGPAGAAGAAGATGAQGPTGPAIFLQAEDAEDGAPAVPGSPGATGATGVAGATGATGPAGPAVTFESYEAEEFPMLAAAISDGTRGDISVTSSGQQFTIVSGAVTYAKMQNVSATDKVLGRSSAGAGVVQEIACTGTGRNVIGAATAAAARTQLGCGTAATSDQLDFQSASTQNSPPMGRLTLVTATPVMTSSQSAKTTIFYTPYVGLCFPWYNGTNTTMVLLSGELSLALDSNAGNTGYHQSGKNFDLFLYVDGGTNRLVSGPAWTNDTTRATSLKSLNGFQVNSGSMTAKFDTSSSTIAVGDGQGTFVGTFRASANGQTHFVFGASAAGGTAGSFYLWNMYNRVRVASFTQNSTANYAWATASWHQANASAGMQVDYVQGLSEDAVEAHYGSSSAAGSTVKGVAGIGVDSTTVVSGVAATMNTVQTVTGTAHYYGYPGIGLHTIAALEYGGSAATFNTTAAPSNNGLFVILMM